MSILKNISLKPYNTFGIDVKSKAFCDIQSVTQLKSVLKTQQNKPLFILGGGSNILLTKDIDALVLHINLKGIEIVKESNSHVEVKAMAGENWHHFVMWCLNKNFGGIENLSLIPGNVGTAPIQNIGAYGVELKDVFVNCEALRIQSLETQTFSKEACKFNYRESIFKNQLKNQYIITAVTFKLSKNNHNINIDYGSIKQELEPNKQPTIKDISEAVIAIRESKLPNPKTIGNSGSFFKNPVISTLKLKQLQSHFPKMPFYPINKELAKVPAAWLIETAGFKGKCFGNYGVHKKQALVLVNYGNANGKDIYNLALLITKTVKRLFDIKLQMEVNIF